MPVRDVIARRRGQRIRVRVKVRLATVRDLDVLVHQRWGMWTDMGGKTGAELDDADSAYRPCVRSRLKAETVVEWLAEIDQRDIVAGAIVWLRPTVPRPVSRTRLNRSCFPCILNPSGAGEAWRLCSWPKQ